MKYKNSFAFMRNTKRGLSVECFSKENTRGEYFTVSKTEVPAKDEAEALVRKHCSRKPVRYLLVWNSEEGDRFPCLDGGWRDTVSFEIGSCLKTWRSLRWAERYAEKRNLKKFTITFLYEGDKILSDGMVIRK